MPRVAGPAELNWTRETNRNSKTWTTRTTELPRLRGLLNYQDFVGCIRGIVLELHKAMVSLALFNSGTRLRLPLFRPDPGI